MEIIFLGTSAMVPTKERNHTSILIRYNSDNILVDCGEGTQRQLKKASIPLPSITKMLITHWDGDHVLGIPGLLQSLASSEYNKTLYVYGPRNTKANFSQIAKLFNIRDKLNIKVADISPGRFLDEDKYYIDAYALDHTSPTLGYSFIEKDMRKVDKSKMKKLKLPEGPLIGSLVEGKTISFKGNKISPDQVTYVKKGKKVTFILDSCFEKKIIGFAKNADCIICESTYSADMESKAKEYKHMTSAQAAEIASSSNAKSLILTHFSARYKSADALEKEAKKIFPNTKAAFDLMRIEV